MDISVLGIDIAKNVFQLHGADKSGEPVNSYSENLETETANTTNPSLRVQTENGK